MVVTRHTRGAPAGIQKQYQRKFIDAMRMQEGEGQPSLTTQGNSPVWQLDADAWMSVLADFHVPIDMITGRNFWMFPVFSMSEELYANIRFGIGYLPMLRGTSPLAPITLIENTIAADGEDTIIPRRPEWLTIEGALITGDLGLFPMEDYAGRIVNIQLGIYRDGESDLDEHPGNLYLQGLTILYEAFI